ncbi:hypothetical protein, partial [Pedobacter borealis]|uniref:hypothetical protein n=1 Tax=Pedobacter borealis TaxID=475254 RepID=UPI001ADFEE91
VPGCKGSNLFRSRNIYFKINPALLISCAILSFKTLPPKRDAKVEKINTNAKLFYGLPEDIR